MYSSRSGAAPTPAFMQQGLGLGNPENIALSPRREGHSTAHTPSGAWAVLCQAQGSGLRAWRGAEAVTPSAPPARASVFVTAALGSVGQRSRCPGKPRLSRAHMKNHG